MKKQVQRLQVSRETLANLSRTGVRQAVAGHITNAVTCITECPTYCLVETQGCT